MTRVKGSSAEISSSVENIQQPDTSSQIGQILYAISLESSTNGCNCQVCSLARELAKLLAKQLREGTNWPRS